MSIGEYVFFLAALLIGAIVLVLIKSRQVEDEEGGQIEVTHTKQQIEGQAMRCAQRIGLRVGLRPRAVKVLKGTLVYVHRNFAGAGDSTSVGQDYAREAVDHLKKMGEFQEGWDEESVKLTISDIVAESLKGASEPKPMQG